MSGLEINLKNTGPIPHQLETETINARSRLKQDQDHKKSVSRPSSLISIHVNYSAVNKKQFVIVNLQSNLCLLKFVKKHIDFLNHQQVKVGYNFKNVRAFFSIYKINLNFKINLKTTRRKQDGMYDHDKFLMFKRFF